VVYDAFAKRGARTVRDVMDVTGVDELMAHKITQRLVRRGLLRKIGVGVKVFNKGRAPAFYSTLAP